jgi:hypothetical protein
MAIINGPLCATISYYGIIGPVASYLFGAIRIMADQDIENTASASTPPWTWPINEQVVDMLHKSIFAFLVCYFSDKYVRGVEWFNWEYVT